MAPHAYTPTTERENVFDISNGVDLNEGAFASEGITTESSVNNLPPNGSTIEIAQGSTNGDISTQSGEDGSITPFLTFEDAYVRGYKDGYTKSYIELKHQPIAIIGMSCRFPGNVSTPDEFWELLARSRTGFTSVPPSRFSENRFFHPNPGKSGTTNARGGNFLEQDLTVFDAPFFGFTQQEAISIDPQQRLLLECTFETLESAGVPKHTVVGQNVGVFVGGTFSEYEADLFRDPETIPMHQATGCAMAMQSNRISHFFDFRGPSFTMDTACSSSLVAIHTACQSLRSGESKMAIAAGVHLNMLPEFWISYSMSRLFGEAGRSFAFDQRGTGYGRGEGCGMILLKPLDQAIANNDPIRAVICGTGINQDGKTPGITMPNGAAQEALIRSVYENVKIDPQDTGYVEAHGTGTRVGDPIEVTALHNVFGNGRTKRKPLFIGSVKSNIGHLEAAAGIAGVIKTALMLERGFVLPNYDFKIPNEKIPFEEWGLKVPTKQQPWPFGKKWASVNGFGFGGTNGHVVMTKGPLERKTMKEEIDTQNCQRLFLVSANDKTSTEKTMQELGIYLERRPEVFQNDLLGNLAYTLGQRKSLHPWRVAISASTGVELVEALFSGKIIPAREEYEELRFGWIFTGQGAQWWAMGRELRQQYPTYDAALIKADAHLRSIGAEFSLLEELEKEESLSQVNAAHISQPSCTAVQLALTDLLRSWGLQPSAVAGHSSGEIGAAYAANMITFEDAMTIAYHRGRLIPLLKNKFPELDGCMMAVGAGQDVIRPLIDRIPQSMGEARVACINSPSSITVSGDAGAITVLQGLIEEAHPGMFARRLQVDTAYHSHHMNLVAKAYTESLMNLESPRESSIQLHSSLVGRLVTSTELDASYWVQNLVCPVKFDEAIQSMCRADGDPKINFLIELGPHAALQGPIKQTLKQMGGSASKIGYSSVLSRNKDAISTAHQLAGALFVKGALLNMESINFPKQLDRRPQVLTDLPRYAWNHSSAFYHESRLTKIHKYHDTKRNDIIGVLAPYSNDFEPTWRNIVRLNDLPWLRHHQIEGVTIFPISGFVSMAIEAADQQAEKNNVQYDRLEVHNLTVDKPAILTEDDLEMTITLYPDLEDAENDALHRFVIRSWSKNNGWMHNCSGSVSTTCEITNEVDGFRTQRMIDQTFLDKNEKAAREATDLVDTSSMYEKLGDIGVNYGKAFKGLENCHASATSAIAHLTTADTLSEMPHNEETEYLVHPTLVERLVTMYWPILSKIGSLQTVHLPSSIGKISVSKRVGEYLRESREIISAFCMPEKFVTDDDTNNLSMFAVDTTGKALIAIENLSTSPILGNSPDMAADSALELCYKLEWESVPESTLTNLVTASFDSEVVLICDETQPQQDLAYILSCELETLTGRAPLMGTLPSMAPYMKGKLCIFLTELDRSMLAELSPSEFESLKQVLTTTDGLLWVVRGAYTNSSNPDGNMILGLSRTLRSEGTLMRFVTLDLDFASDRTHETDATSIMKVFMTTLQPDSKVEETEFMERDGALFTPRIVDDPAMNEYVQQKVHPPKTEPAQFSDIQRPLKATLGSPDAAEKLVFEDDLAANLPLGPDDVFIQVRATGINLKDTTSHLAIGSECSGTVVSVGSNVLNIKAGDRVAAITAEGSLATTIHAESSYVCKLPDHVSFEAAAAMSVAYCTALYSLVDQARLMDGEQILIHDAASPVGQAALCIAKMVGVDAWTTVRTANEKELLMREFGIPEYRIWSLNSDTIVQRIMAFTNGKGIEVAFNPVAEASALRTSARCLADFGRLVKVSSGHSDIASLALAKNVTIISTDIAAIAAHRPQIVQRALADMGRLLRYGKIEPIHGMKTLSMNEFATTLQEVRAAKENEMVVVVPSDDEVVLAPRIDANLPCLRQDATYILIGGTGGLGRSMAQWMVGKGAKHIVLLSRSGTLKGKAKDQVDALNDNGASIIVRSCDVSNRVDVEGLIAGLHDLPPVRGIVHGAMVLHDVLFEKMTYDQYSSVTASKVQGAWNFHHALNESGAVLDFFICISSAAGAVGNRGQAAYAAANTFLNGFVQHLRGMGISAASIDLTAVSDAGYLAEDKEKAAEVARNLGSDTICEAEVLALIEGAINGALGSCNSHPITGMRLAMRPFWWSDAKFKHLREAAEAASSSASGTKTICWSTAFKSAPSRADAEQTVVSALVEKIAEVISMEPEALDPARALSHYPLDSLTAIEVRNFITRMFEANLQVLELLASGTIESLARLVCTKSKVALPEAAES